MSACRHVAPAHRSRFDVPVSVQIAALSVCFPAAGCQTQLRELAAAHRAQEHHGRHLEHHENAVGF